MVGLRHWIPVYSLPPSLVMVGEGLPSTRFVFSFDQGIEKKKNVDPGPGPG
jgi:hypothetical protein